MKSDLAFVAGTFFDYDPPKHQQYLWKYFTTKIQKEFVRYYLVFGSHEHFVDHTGVFCSIRWRQVLTLKIKKIEAALKEAKETNNSQQVALIESGNFPL